MIQIIGNVMNVYSYYSEFNVLLCSVNNHCKEKSKYVI